MSTDVVDKWIKWHNEHKDEIAIEVDLHPEFMATYKRFCKTFKIPLALVGLAAPAYPRDGKTNES